jgi:hypothetical protein
MYALQMEKALCKVTERVFGDGTGDILGLISNSKEIQRWPEIFSI